MCCRLVHRRCRVVPAVALKHTVLPRRNARCWFARFTWRIIPTERLRAESGESLMISTQPVDFLPPIAVPRPA
eukprot:3066348-Pleurochrysis_carterae.AAC.2